MQNPFQNSNWKAEISTMGFQSLIYDENGLLVASVEPTDPNRVGPKNSQKSKLIALAPRMLRFVLTIQEQMPSPERRAIINELFSDDLKPQ